MDVTVAPLVFGAKYITDKDNIPFSPVEYSKFKFGDKDIAKKFGFQLAEAFISLLSVLPKDSCTQIVICSSPYCFIPTATFAMKDYFIQKLNVDLVELGYPVVQETKVHRTVTYSEDYGGLTAEERLGLIGKDSFHIDREFVKDKMVFFLDDIRITGSHEKMIEKMAKDCLLEEICAYGFLYYAVLDNPKIHPSIENELNYAFVKNLLDLDKIIKNENFLLNTRVIKFILNSSIQEFKTFIQYQSISFQQTVYHLALGNSYHLIKEYKKNLNYLKNLLKNNL